MAARRMKGKRVVAAAAALWAVLLLPGARLYALADEMEADAEIGYDEATSHEQPYEEAATGDPPTEEALDGQAVPTHGTTYTYVYDPQPETTEDILEILAQDTMPCWQYPVEEALLPEGFALLRVEADGSPPYYSIEYREREATTRTVGTAAALREAFADLVDGDVIVLATSLDLGSLAADDGVPAALSIPSGANVTLRADENGPYRLYRRDGQRHFALHGVAESTLTLENIVLQGLYSEGGDKLVYGGGIELEDCRDVTLRGANVVGTAAAEGGAVCVVGSENIVFESPRLAASAAQNGGGLAVQESTLTVQGGQLESNTAASLGGGLYGYGSEITLRGVAVEGNTAPWGGGLHLTAATARLECGSVLHGNTAYTDELDATAQGGAARLENGAQLTLAGTTVTGNRAEAEKGDSMGGALVVCGSSSFAANGAVIEDNRAEAGYGLGYGGGVYLGRGNSATALEDTELAGNRADVGGGVYLNEGACLTLGQQGAARFTRNRAAMGGGALCAYEQCQLAIGGKATFESNAAGVGEDIYLYDSAALQWDENTAPLAETVVTAAEAAVAREAEAFSQPGVDSVPYLDAADGVVFIPMELAANPMAGVPTFSPAAFVLMLCSVTLGAILLMWLVPSRLYRDGRVPKQPRGTRVWAVLGALAGLGSVALYMLRVAYAPFAAGGWLMAGLGLLAVQLACVVMLRLNARRAGAPTRE